MFDCQLLFVWAVPACPGSCDTWTCGWRGVGRGAIGPRPCRPHAVLGPRSVRRAGRRCTDRSGRLGGGGAERDRPLPGVRTRAPDATRTRSTPAGSRRSSPPTRTGIRGRSPATGGDRPGPGLLSRPHPVLCRGSAFPWHRRPVAGGVRRLLHRWVASRPRHRRGWLDGRWVRFDPEIDAPRPSLPTPMDIGPCRLDSTGFVTAAEAWVGLPTWGDRRRDLRRGSRGARLPGAVLPVRRGDLRGRPSLR